MKITFQLLVLVLSSAALLACSKTTHATPKMIWPPLSEFAAVAGRAATTDDIAADRAVFVLQDAGKPIGEPMSIAVPQYALHRDEHSGVQTPCVIIQAEQARGQQMIGACILPGRAYMAGLSREFEFLGTTPPVDR